MKAKGQSGEKKRGGERKWRDGKFDAGYLIDRYENMAWMEGVRIEKVAICEMGAKDVVQEEGESVGNGQKEPRMVQQEYKEIASVELPG